MNRFYRHIWSLPLGQVVAVPECAGGTAGRRTTRRRANALSLALLFSVLGNAPAHAQSFWSGGAGDWFDAGNWAGGVPGAGDIAIVNNGGTAQIGAAGAVSSIGSAGETAGNSGTVEVDGAGSTWAIGNTLYVGNSGTGRLDVTNGGAVSNHNGAIGTTATGSGTATIDGASSTWTNGGQLTIGELGSGILDITSGGVVSNTFAIIANQAGSSGDVTVDGAGSEWNFSSNLAVGNSGDATLSISGGGAVSNVDGFVGYFAAGSSAVTVDGADSIWTNSGELYIGVWGGATLDITDGGAVSNTIGHIGRHDTGDGEVTVSGANSTWTNSDWLHVGHSGTGELTVESGGAVQNVIGLIGSAVDSTGTVTVRNADSIWTNTNNMAVGYFGDGTLAVEAGGAVINVQGFVGDQSTATGFATVTGAGSTWTNSGLFAVGNFGEGTLDILDGGLVSNTTGHIGRNANSTGAVTVDGEDSTWTNSGELRIGEAASGTLDISGGGAVSNTSGIIGYAAASSGGVTVDGADSIWTNSGALTVGRAATGAGGNPGALLSITDGGAVTNTAGTIGNLAGSTGEVTVDGAGSTWANSGDLVVGATGSGTLGISGGGAVSNASGFIGDLAAGTGAVTVDGADSTWTNTGGNGLNVGWMGSATLDISNGGAVSSLAGHVGRQADSTGTVTVSGAGSVWSIVGALLVGNSGSGTLTLSDGGVAEAASVTIASNASSTGTLNIGAASGDAAAGAGTLDAASVVFGSGAGTLVFNHTGNDHLFGADISGDGEVRVESGQTTLTGTNTYTGGTTIAGGRLVGNSASLVGDIEMDASGDQLYFDQSTDGSFTGTIGGGDGYVAKIGAGELTFEDADIDVDFFHAAGGTTVFDGGAVLVDALHSGFFSDAGHAAAAAGLRIEGGAQVTSKSGSLGSDDASFGATVEVSGIGTKWSVGTELVPTTTFYIRGVGDADLRVENGGVVEVFGDVVISSVEPGKTAALAVDGAGSTFLSSTDIDLGSIVDGNGRIAVSNGGVVRVAGGAGAILAAQHEDTASVEIVIGAAEGDAATGAGTLDVASVDFGGADAGNGSLVFNHTALDYIFAPVVSGFGTIWQLAGITRLDGENSGFEGATRVTGGTLLVIGMLGGDIQVSGGGRLGGTGNLENVTIGNGGIFAPGNSVGTVIANGDVTFGDGAVYEVEVNDGTGLDFIDRPGRNNDYIDVRGALAIDSGAVVEVSPENGTDTGATYTPGLLYTILSATGGVTGTFGAVTASFAFLTPELSYDSNNVFLELVQNDVGFADVGKTPNQKGVGNTVQQFGPGHPLYDEVIMMTEEEARAAYDALSGEAHASASVSQFMTAGEIRQQLLNRIAALLGSGGAGLASLSGAPAAGDAAPGTASIWGQLFGGWGETDADINAAAIDRRIHGFIGGADREVAPGINAGFALGYSRTSYDVAARASSGDSDNFHIAGYAGATLGDVNLKGILAYGYGRAETQRSVVVGGVTNNLSASYGTHTVQAAVEAAIDFDAGPVTLTPFAGLAGVHVKAESFTETGGPAALTFDSASNTTGISTLGLRVSRVAGQVEISGAAAWRHAFGDVEPASRAAFASAPASTFAVRGAPVSADALMLDAAVTARLDTSTTLTLGYSGEYASDARDHGLRAELRIEF